MNEYSVKDFIQSDAGDAAVLMHNETGSGMVIFSTDFMSESDFLYEVFRLTSDPRFDPCSCSRMVAERK